MGLRCIIAGSRDFQDYRRFVDIVKQCPFVDEIERVVSGAARGVDRMGELWAESMWKPVDRFPANGSTHGKAAGPIRNQAMAEAADALIAIPMGASCGTRDMIRRAEKAGLRVWVFEA